MHLSEREVIRRQSLEELQKLGINPYPADLFEVNTTARSIHDKFAAAPESFKQVSLAGRMMTRRIMGNASFAELQDETGKIQVYFRRDDLCPGDDKNLYNVVFKKALDIGDILGVRICIYYTNRGDIHSCYFAQGIVKIAQAIARRKETTDERGM